MTYDRSVIDDEEIPSSLLFNNDMLRWQTQQSSMDYSANATTSTSTSTNDMVPLQAVINPSNTDNTITNRKASATTINSNTNTTTTNPPVPAINTTNPALAPPPPILDPTKQYHPEWGVIKDGDFHALTLKHQRDLENHFQTNNPIADFYFWQANLGGYCMADMVQGKLTMD
ncbi:unnamed protein product [Mucor hiemalis]